MKKFGLILLALAFIGSADAGKHEDAAQAAATAWLQLIDTGHYTESWQQAASPFQSQITKEAWTDALQRIREPLGAVKLRHLKNAQYTTSLPGAPDGQYVVMQFDTQFENKQQGIETVTSMLKGNAWKVSGYYVK
ncbi:DUF4019 domain-containing protein [Ectothiorhodospira lacustris]|uniref:DUF4019 domain-containing protein n=1 Tax=Ectothiorhodospira lacustris TaxID=2899127 RepID=UPI001EE8A70F|nr:DUF4019 domain-containing protein [Ectothiorhodospira lacustris]MCG5501509.1 DUF4019 domain-containing protein [Ectothiorhodospira lacustris]